MRLKEFATIITVTEALYISIGCACAWDKYTCELQDRYDAQATPCKSSATGEKAIKCLHVTVLIAAALRAPPQRYDRYR